jgi:hypothetical protein
MRVDQGITNVPSNGTAVQVANATNRVKFVKFRALTGNSDMVYVGVSDVSASLGYELDGGNELELNFGEFGGSVPANVFYVDAETNNDKVAWIMIMEG